MNFRESTVSRGKLRYLKIIDGLFYEKLGELIGKKSQATIILLSLLLHNRVIYVIGVKEAGRWNNMTLTANNEEIEKIDDGAR